MKLAYDNVADALAIRVADGIVDHTVEVEIGTMVDVDAVGHALVIEVVHPARRWALDEVIARFAVSADDERVLRGIFDGAFSFEPTSLAVA